VGSFSSDEEESEDSSGYEVDARDEEEEESLRGFIIEETKIMSQRTRSEYSESINSLKSKNSITDLDHLM